VRSVISLIIAAYILLCLSNAWGAVAVDTTSTGTVSSNSVVTWSHTVSGANTLLICSAHISSGGAVSAFTFNSVALTAKATRASSASNYLVEMWFLIAPASGTHTVSLTLASGADNLVGGCTSFTGADQTTPLGSASTNTNNDDLETSPPSIVVPSSGLGYDVAFFGNSSGDCSQTRTPGGSQTKRFDDCVGSVAFHSIGVSSTISTSTTMSWTNLSGGVEAQIAVPINPVGAVTRRLIAPLVFR